MELSRPEAAALMQRQRDHLKRGVQLVQPASELQIRTEGLERTQLALDGLAVIVSHKEYDETPIALLY